MYPGPFEQTLVRLRNLSSIGPVVTGETFENVDDRRKLLVYYLTHSESTVIGTTNFQTSVKWPHKK